MIRAARAAIVERRSARDGGCAQIPERLEPGFEDGSYLVISHCRNATEAAGAGVVVEIGRQLGILGFRLHGFAIGEMLLDVGLGAEQTFLLPTPERDANGAVQLDVESLENADGFDRDRAARAVVGRARAAMPGIEVSAEHDDLVLVGTRARNLADYVE